MKNLMIFVFVCLLAFAACDSDTYIPLEDLPSEITAYVAENYPGDAVLEAEVEDAMYEVKLESGIELYFDADGNFLSEEIDED